MNLVQIRNAILETVYLGVIEAYLRSKMHGQTFNKMYGMSARSGPMLRGQLAQEVDDFMAVCDSCAMTCILNKRLTRAFVTHRCRKTSTASIWCVPSPLALVYRAQRKLG
jgi:hypothetical protein